MTIIHEQQSWTTQSYEKHAHFVPELGMPVLKLLDPKPQEEILDIGCGDGVLTKEIAGMGANVIGIDSSEALLDSARSKGLSVFHEDAQDFNLEERFDAVFTNAALHWMLDAEAVVQCVTKHLKPLGRFVGEFGGHGNVAAIVTALLAVLQHDDPERAPRRHPWFFPTPEEYGSLLEKHGFTVKRMDLIPRPTPLPTDIGGWMETFADPFFRHVPDEMHKKELISRVEALLTPTLKDSHGKWTADYVRLRFYATL